SYRTPNQPLPMESNPRKVFYTMFGQGDTKRERTAILKSTDSLLYYVKDSAASLNRKLDAGDRARVSDYLDSVREIEIRVRQPEPHPGRSRRDFREVCRADQEHARWRRFDTRPFDHFVRE